MDIQFFSKRLFTISSYQGYYILLNKERLYYYRYLRKLRYKLMTLGYNGNEDVNKALQFINQFEKKEIKRVKNGFFYKPSKALIQACRDCRDVMESMKRYEGVYE